MKALLLLLLILSTGTLLAQTREQPKPTVGVLALVHERDKTGVSLQLANVIGSDLRADKSGSFTFKGETIQIHAETLSDGALFEQAKGHGLSFVAVVDFTPGLKPDGAFTVELARIAADKIIEKTTLAMGVIEEGASYLGSQLARISRSCVSGITAAVSHNLLVHVFFNLCVKPANGSANYYLGKSDLRTTDERGLGTWDASLPVGSLLLRVMRAGFQDATTTVEVPMSKNDVVIRKTIELHP